MFFYGQNYGLALVEALLVSGGILVFGTTMLGIKIPMLVLWMASVSLLGRSCSILMNRDKALLYLFMAIAVLSPTWLVWSMKARSGYLSSFFFSSLAIYLVVSRSARCRPWVWASTGVLVALIYESQPLWLPGVIPIVAFYLYRGMPGRADLIKSAAALTAGLLVPLTLLHLIRSDRTAVWGPPKLASIFERLNLATLLQLPEVLLGSLGGNYYLGTVYSPANLPFAAAFLVLFAAGAALAVAQTWRERAVGIPLALLVAAVLSLAGFTLSSNPRYLLPFAGFAMLMLAGALAGARLQGRRRGAAIALLVTTASMGAASLPGFSQFSYINMSIDAVDERPNRDLVTMEKLIALLEEEGIRYVYSTNDLMQYQLSYLTANRITTAGAADRCRIPANVQRIREAYPTHSDEFAVIGYNFHRQYSGKVPMIDGEIIYVLRPSRPGLERVGFFSGP